MGSPACSLAALEESEFSTMNTFGTHPLLHNHHLLNNRRLSTTTNLPAPCLAERVQCHDFLFLRRRRNPPQKCPQVASPKLCHQAHNALPTFVTLVLRTVPLSRIPEHGSQNRVHARILIFTGTLISSKRSLPLTIRPSTLLVDDHELSPTPNVPGRLWMYYVLILLIMEMKEADAYLHQTWEASTGSENPKQRIILVG